MSVFVQEKVKKEEVKETTGLSLFDQAIIPIPEYKLRLSRAPEGPREIGQEEHDDHRPIAFGLQHTSEWHQGMSLGESGTVAPYSH